MDPSQHLLPAASGVRMTWTKWFRRREHFELSKTWTWIHFTPYIFGDPKVGAAKNYVRLGGQGKKWSCGEKNISAPSLSRQHSNLLLPFLGPLLQILFDGAGNSIPANEMEKRSKQINNEDRGREIRDKKSRRQRWFSLQLSPANIWVSVLRSGS